MCLVYCVSACFFFFKQMTAYELRFSDWSSDVCSSDLDDGDGEQALPAYFRHHGHVSRIPVSCSRARTTRRPVPRSADCPSRACHTATASGHPLEGPYSP